MQNIMISQILNLLDKKKKIKITLILVLIILSSFLELIGIGIIPILVSVSLDDKFIINKFGDLNIYNFSISDFNPNRIILFLSITMFTIFVVKNLILAFTTFHQAKVLKDISRNNAERLYRTYLNQPFTFFLDSNPNILSRNILIENQAIKSIITMILYIIKELFLLFGILIVLIYLNWKVTVVILFFINLISITYLLFFRKKIINLGTSSQKIRGQQLTHVNQVFGAIKDIIISNKQRFVLEVFKNKNDIYEKGNMTIQFITYLPKLIFETAAVFIICIFFLFLSFTDVNKIEYFSLITFAAISLIRIIPSYNLITSSLNKIQFMKPSLDIISAELLKNNLNLDNFISNREKKINNNGYIIIENLKFNYVNAKKSLIKNFSAKIKIGSIVGIAGPSGSGKSTLINLISGLLMPDSGRILVNDLDLRDIKLSWYDLIGYVSQDIFLLNDTIKNNIAFGIPENEIDFELINKVIQKTELTKTINNLEKKLDTFVGERGIRISGGQKQRIGIARALYKNPKILILDEATSSLDNDLEKLIIENITQNKNNDVTILIVAHRLSSLKNCDKILYIKNESEYEIFDNYDAFITFSKKII